MKGLKKLGCDDRVLLGSIFTLAWPAMLEQALQTVVQYADSAMVGQLGAQSTAAVGITTPVSWLVNAPMFAMGVGFLACISRALGAKDEKTARTAAGQTIFAVLILGIGIGLLTVGLSPFIPGWLNAAPEIQATASRYFAIVCLPMIFRAASALFSSALRAAGNTRTPMLVNAAMNAINLVLNFFLIFDSCTLTLFGRELLIPRAGLGVEGAAIASAISYVFSGLMMFRALWRSPLSTPKGMRLRLEQGGHGTMCADRRARGVHADRRMSRSCGLSVAGVLAGHDGAGGAFAGADHGGGCVSARLRHAGCGLDAGGQCGG